VTIDLALDPNGRIWVLTWLLPPVKRREREEAEDFKGCARLEVFSIEGVLLTAIPIDIWPSIMKFDLSGDLWILDNKHTASIYHYAVRWP